MVMMKIITSFAFIGNFFCNIFHCYYILCNIMILYLKFAEGNHIYNSQVISLKLVITATNYSASFDDFEPLA